MNVFRLIPPKLRLVVYLGFGVLGLVAVYASKKGIIGDDELELLSAIGTFLGLTAAANVELNPELTELDEYASKHETG